MSWPILRFVLENLFEGGKKTSFRDFNDGLPKYMYKCLCTMTDRTHINSKHC